jgi:hypothetical protein
MKETDAVLETDDELIVLRAKVADLETALAALKAERSAQTIQTAGRLAQLAWILMVIMVVFAGTIIVASAIRASARECPAISQPRPVERP